MKVIIAGDRNFTDLALMKEEIKKSGFEITELVCGMARGADMLAYEWAAKRGIPIKSFHAIWSWHGKAAGPMRNQEMAKYGEALIAFLAKGSKGTRNMIYEAKKKGLPMHVVRV